jgi:PAS domain S-box-containing protein
MKPQIRLSHKLIVLVLLTTAVAVVVPGAVVINRARQALELKEAEHMEEVAGRTAPLLGKALDDDVDKLHGLADEVLAAGPEAARREAAERRWFSWADNNDGLEIGCFSDAPGRAWHAARGGQTESGPPALGRPMEQLRPYKGALVGLDRDAAGRVTLVFVSKEPDRYGDRYLSRLSLANYDALLRDPKLKVGQTGYMFVVDAESLLVAHPAEHWGEPEQTPAYAAVGRDLSGLAAVRAAEQGVAAPGTFHPGETGELVVSGGAKIPELGWVVVAEQSEREATADIREITRQVVVWGTAAGLVAILLGLLIIRQLTRPVETLMEAANRVGEGDLTTPVGVATRDELGQLALAFNEMQVRLREMYDKLERMVEERTRELQQTTDFLNSVLDSSTEYSIIATDLGGTILSYNEGSRRTYGYEPEEIIGAPITILVPSGPEEHRRSREILRHARSEGSYSGELEHVRKGGKRFPVRVVMTLRYDSEGAPVGYTTVSRDITDRKELEAKLREYTENLEALVDSKTGQLQEANTLLERANRLKAEFLASMSHELRTPLNAILGFADVLREELTGPLNDQQRQFTADILESGRQLLNLINDILDLSKVDAGKMELDAEEVELAGIFDEVQTIIQGMAVRKGLSLSFREEPPGLRVRVDRVKLLQILYNLLSNAVKFTAAGGSVRVETERREGATYFRVIDTGVGIPADSLELIFEEFRQVDARLSREYGGTGLGLALTRKLVALHGGTITVESQVGKGSVFTFTIPDVLPGEETRTKN